MLCWGYVGEADLLAAMLLLGLIIGLLVNEDCVLVSGIFISRRTLVPGHLALRLAKALANDTCGLVCIKP